jgi:hypothetical protein
MIEQYRQSKIKDSRGNTVSTRYTFFKFENYKTIILDKSMSLDEISFRYYGTPLYYWAIGEANNISDPFINLDKGVKIKIPVL